MGPARRSAFSIRTAPAVRARDQVLAEAQAALDAALAPDHDVTVTDDAGAFHPAPLGVLVGLPSLAGRGLAARTYVVPVHVVSADPLNSLPAVESLFELADLLVVGLGAATYTPGEWSGGVNRDPLPSVELAAMVVVTESED